jgi:hypothetical protein
MHARWNLILLTTFLMKNGIAENDVSVGGEVCAPARSTSVRFLKKILIKMIIGFLVSSIFLLLVFQYG